MLLTSISYFSPFDKNVDPSLRAQTTKGFLKGLPAFIPGSDTATLSLKHTAVYELLRKQYCFIYYFIPVIPIFANIYFWYYYFFFGGGG